MMTITQNDASPELLAHGRRGVCASSTDDEMVEHLFTHRRSHHEPRPDVTKDACAAVISFQKRTHAVKARFLAQHKRSAIGVPTDHWDRTEAQARHSLHSHIPFWCKRRRLMVNRAGATVLPTRARVQTLPRHERKPSSTADVTTRLSNTADRRNQKPPEDQIYQTY